MKKNIATVILLIACIFISTELNATDLSGSFGVGYNTSVQSVSCKYFFGSFGINLLVGVSGELQNVMLYAQTKIDFRGTLYGLYAIEILDRANLNLFLGGEFEYIGSHSIGQSDINYYARTGLSPEIFIFDNLSIETSFGLQISAKEFSFPNTYIISFGMFGQDISIVSGFAFHWYFGKSPKGNTEIPVTR
jgi:hypothetical protein